MSLRKEETLAFVCKQNQDYSASFVSKDHVFQQRIWGQEVVGTMIDSPSPCGGCWVWIWVGEKGEQRAKRQPAAFQFGTCVLDFLGQYQFLIIGLFSMKAIC